MRMMSEIISLPFYDIRWMKKMVIRRAKRAVTALRQSILKAKQPFTALRQSSFTAGEQV